MLCKIVGVMEVDDSLLIRLNNIFRKKKSSREILADFASHIVTLYAVDRRILVGIFLHNLFVVALDQGQDPFVTVYMYLDEAKNPQEKKDLAMIWVAMLQAVEKLCGRSINVSLITVPFCSISSRFTRSQLCICCAK